MQKQQPRAHWLRWLGALIIMALLVTACKTGGPIVTEGHDAGSEHNEGSDEHEGEHDLGESHDEHSEEHEDLGRIPNEGGAAIHIISPQDGEVITGSEVIVEVEVENFDQTLRGLELGEHTIEVHLALGRHEELEDGSTVSVTVSE